MTMEKIEPHNPGMAGRAKLASQARILIVHVCGLIVAAGVAAGLFALTSSDANVFPITFWVALAHAVILGLPTYLFLRVRGSPSWWTAPIGGFAIGCLPIGLLALVPAADQASTGDVPTIVNGFRTAAGWLEYLTLVSGAGALGAVAGLGFGLCVQGTLPKPGATMPPSRIAKIGEGVSIGVACTFLVAAITLPSILEDRSCHNPMRGRSSLGSELSASLSITSIEWPEFVAIVQDFAHRHGWSYRGDVRSSPDFEWLQISVCAKEGTEFSAIYAKGLPGIMISVSQPQGGSSWKLPYADLYRVLHAKWPTQIKFSGDQGRPIAPPDWLSSASEKEERHERPLMGRSAN